MTLEAFYFPIFEGLALKACTFTRQGGVLQEHNYASLSFSHPTKHEIISHHIELALNTIGAKLYVRAKQIHSDSMYVVTDTTVSPICDILITQSSIALMMLHADCQIAIIYDPIQHVVATIHAGWKGLAQSVYQKTISFLQYKYASKPENLFIAISASLGANHCELIDYKTLLPPSLWGFQIKPNYFDLKAIALEELLQCKCLMQHIYIEQACTYSDPEKWFSYRRDGICGRNATIAMLQ